MDTLNGAVGHVEEPALKCVKLAKLLVCVVKLFFIVRAIVFLRFPAFVHGKTLYIP